MTGLSRDDIRAGVRVGILSEAQAADLLALSDSRRGVRENLDGLNEPFELFKGFNEIFIVVGLSILTMGYVGLMGSALFDGPAAQRLLAGGLSFAGIALLARYFILRRRMVAPAIMLALLAGGIALQLGFAIADGAQLADTVDDAVAVGLAAAVMLGFWRVFHVPFALLLVAGGAYYATFSATVLGGAQLDSPEQLFLLTADGPFALVMLILGGVTLAAALVFDLSDPHRVTRRAGNAFWLHVVAAPAIVNTVALSLFDIGGSGARWGVFAFLLVMTLVAVVIDRRSFLISGVGYAVGLVVAVLGDAAALVIFPLGVVLVLLGAHWERLRRAIMTLLPDFPGKTRLPPYATAKVTQ